MRTAFGWFQKWPKLLGKKLFYQFFKKRLGFIFSRKLTIFQSNFQIYFGKYGSGYNYFPTFWYDFFMFCQKIAREKIILAFFMRFFHLLSNIAPNKIYLPLLNTISPYFVEKLLKENYFAVFPCDLINFSWKIASSITILPLFNKISSIFVEKLLRKNVFCHFSSRFFHFISEKLPRI